MIVNKTKKNLTFIRNTHSNTHKINTIAALLILSVVAFYQLFYNLDKLPLRVWDEGKNAVSAYEMYTNGNYFVRYYEGQPDHWGFKPPFLTWNQVISMKLFGINEFAVRFPSALYALFTVMLLFYFFFSEFKKPFLGLLASLILLTSFGYLEHHIARTGDHDSILVFFLTSQLIFFYKYINTSKNVYLIFFTIALVFASLTKGIAGLFFVPGIGIYVVLSANIKRVTSDRRIYFCILAYLIFIGGYYALREISAPGYVRAVWENELLPRYTNTASNYKYEHSSDYLFYIRNLWDKRLVPWVYILPFMLLLLSLSKHKKAKLFYWYVLTVGISFLAIISGGSKGTWYDAPIFPLIAIYLTLGFLQLNILLEKILSRKDIATIITLLVLAPILFKSIQNTKKLTFEIEEKTWNYETQGISYFLRDHLKELSNLKELGIAYNGYHSHIRFYSNVVSDNGTNTYFANYKELDAPSIVIASQKEVKDFIEEHYIFTKEKKEFGTYVYSIESRKQGE
ncbi:MAG: glycosyltransferase family 39 protein [Bacteroidales bacterium]|nr:glycosyltransferase family 39 protein [Bacteroidales bacterium]